MVSTAIGMIGEFWDKARSEDEVRGHPLLAHSLDVAAVAILLAGGRHLGMDPRMVSLHDIGKYSRPFQAKARGCWPVGALGPYPTTNPPPGQRMTSLDCTSWPMFMPTA